MGYVFFIKMAFPAPFLGDEVGNRWIDAVAMACTGKACLFVIQDLQNMILVSALLWFAFIRHRGNDNILYLADPLLR